MKRIGTPRGRLAWTLASWAVVGCATACGSSGGGGSTGASGSTDDGGLLDATTDGASGEGGSGDGSLADGGSESGTLSDGGTLPEGSVLLPDGGVQNGPVTFSIDLTKGPASQYAPSANPVKVSNYVYGVNATGSAVSAGTKWGIIRQGGNDFTDYNWTNNFANLGASNCFGQAQDPGGSALAGAMTQTADSIPAAQAKGEAVLATVSIVDYVPAAVTNSTANACPGMVGMCMTNYTPGPVDSGAMSSTTVNVNAGTFAFASETPTSPAFVPNVLTKPMAAFCTCAPGATCSGCAVSTSPVYQDEFVNFIKASYGGATSPPVFFSLDNEPNYWGDQHPEIWPHMGSVPCQKSTVTDDDIVHRDLAAAKAVKAVWPTAKVFGPAVAQDGLIYAHSYEADPHWPTEFLDYYLSQMASASANDAGGPLLDALDVHYYNGSTGDPQQCVQNPRMFWDPNYTSLSPSATDFIDFQYSGQTGNYFDVNWYPRKLIPRLLGKISAAYAGAAAPGLAISEYNSGCQNGIAGGLAEADLLGVFGREGVFAAMAKVTSPAPAAGSNFLLAAFDLYRNYDGNGATVGDTAVFASTSDVTNTSVYAFAHSDNASAVDLVVVNKSTLPTPVNIAVAGAPSLTTATVYSLTSGTAAVAPSTEAAPSVTCSNGACSISVTLDPFTASTYVLRP